MSDVEHWVGTKVDEDGLDEGGNTTYQDDSNARSSAMPFQPPLKGPGRGLRHSVVVVGRDREKSSMTTTRHKPILAEIVVQT